MNKCIYSKKDNSNATFKSAEHVFPKCIGGRYCLPRGTVSDQINNEFSKIELTFARENPVVAIRRMFCEKTGRKKHQNRDRISVFDDNDSGRITLGYIVNGKPICLDQVVFPNITNQSIEEKITCHVVLSPDLEQTNREKTNMFFNRLDSYNGCPTTIKSKKIPERTYLIGLKENKWFLGIHEKENPETVKPMLKSAIEKLVADKENVLCVAERVTASQSHVKAYFEYGINLIDTMRVYAKIAFNAFAALNTPERVLSQEFDIIRNTICTGDGILDITVFLNEEISIRPIFDQFHNQVELGDQFHSVTFVTNDKILYAFVSLYGTDAPVRVRIGPCDEHYTDVFICDWQNQKDYKLIDYIVEVCKDDEE